jgi:serine/threonine-protein kinase
MARRPPDDYPPPPEEYPTREGYPPPREDYPPRYRRADEYEEYEVRGRRPPPPWTRESPWLWLALLAILLAAGVLIAYVAFRNDRGNASTTTVTLTRGTGVTTTVTTQQTTTVTTQPKLVNVPSVSGQTQIAAITSVQSAGFVPNSYPVPSSQQRGTVVAQNPAAGGQLQEGQPVRLNVSTGTGSRPTVSIPTVTGQQASDARLALARAKLCVLTSTRKASSASQVGRVVAQSPAAGTSVQWFAQVTIYVGT